MKEYKIFKRTTSSWDYQKSVCNEKEMYFLKYPIKIFGFILFWREFFELECDGNGDCFGVIIYENDVETLIKRWTCEQNKEIIQELKV